MPHLHRIDRERNMARFYNLSIQPSLFGDFAVVRHWGRIGTRGQGKEDWFNLEGAAHQHAEKLEAKKRRRGYLSAPKMKTAVSGDQDAAPACSQAPEPTTDLGLGCGGAGHKLRDDVQSEKTPEL